MYMLLVFKLNEGKQIRIKHSYTSKYTPFRWILIRITFSDYTNDDDVIKYSSNSSSEQNIMERMNEYTHYERE